MLNPLDAQTTLQEAFTSKVRNAGRRFTAVWSIWHWWNDTLDTGRFSGCEELAAEMETDLDGKPQQDSCQGGTGPQASRERSPLTKRMPDPCIQRPVPALLKRPYTQALQQVVTVHC